MTTTTSIQRRVRWLVLLLAAVLSFALSMLFGLMATGSATAVTVSSASGSSTTSVPALQTRVGVSATEMILVVGVRDVIGAGQCRGEVLSQPQLVSGLCVAAEEAGAGSNVVYRGLAEGENPAAGLTARAPGADVSPMSHVAGKGASPWISTSKSLDIATNKYGKFGVIGIDLSKVGGEVVDVSGGFPGAPGMLSNWARLDQEVLIRDYVPPEAIFSP